MRDRAQRGSPRKDDGARFSVCISGDVCSCCMVGWMEGDVFRLSQRMRYRIPSTPGRRSEFLLRAPPSDSKVWHGALSLARHAKSYMSCRLRSQGFGTCRLAGRLLVARPYLHIGPGVLVACLVATARVQREQRPGVSVLRGHLGCAPCLLCHGLAWSARVFETRSSLCAETAVRNFVRALRHAPIRVSKTPRSVLSQLACQPHGSPLDTERRKRILESSVSILYEP